MHYNDNVGITKTIRIINTTLMIEELETILITTWSVNAQVLPYQKNVTNKSSESMISYREVNNLCRLLIH